MPQTFYAQILTPEGKLFEGEVQGVQAPGTAGSFEMKADHAPVISTLNIGPVRVETADSDVLYFAVTGGFVEMNDNQMALLAEVAERVEDIDAERAMRARTRALERLMKEDTDRLSTEKALKRAENRLKLIEERG
ncbi:MAG: ATP synthase F1 subunit epsilon [Balneolaceae bacterium]